jgi:tRNA A37 threonylcarbamoyladenosine modification protein TsaB
MTLYINTIIDNKIKIVLILKNKKEIVKISQVKCNQAEKLLVLINNLLLENKISLRHIKKIIVADKGGSFTSLRVGILSANALAYALKVPVISESGRNAFLFKNFQIVKPIYSQLPNIGQSKKKILD